MTRSSAALPDILLVSPPVGNFAQVHPAICLLTAYVQAAGFRAVQKDISIDCFHHFHSRAYLMALKSREQSGIEAYVLNQELDRQAALKVSAKIRLVLLLDRVARDVEDAKTELRDPAILDRPDRLAAALRVLKDVGRSITAAHPGQHFNFQEFRIDGAFDDWESLQTALSDANSNLMLPYRSGPGRVPRHIRDLSGPTAAGACYRAEVARDVPRVAHHSGRQFRDPDGGVLQDRHSLV